MDWFYTSFIHISSLGDGFVPAPGADLIEPEIDKQAELIKYKLFDLNIVEADIHIMEDSTITRLQVAMLVRCVCVGGGASFGPSSSYPLAPPFLYVHISYSWTKVVFTMTITLRLQVATLCCC